MKPPPDPGLPTPLLNADKRIEKALHALEVAYASLDAAQSALSPVRGLSDQYAETARLREAVTRLVHAVRITPHDGVDQL